MMNVAIPTETPIYWRAHDGVKRRLDEMTPGHLLNAAEHIDTRIDKLRRERKPGIRKLRVIQKAMRAEAKRQTAGFGFGELAAIEMERQSMKRIFARHFHAKTITRQLRRPPINFLELLPYWPHEGAEQWP